LLTHCGTAANSRFGPGFWLEEELLPRRHWESHMDASDLIKSIAKHLARRGLFTYGESRFRNLRAKRRETPMPMRIDAYTHFFPPKIFVKLNEVAGDSKDIGKRVRSLPALFDLNVRKKIVDGHKDYQQILCYPQPPIERFAKTPQDANEFCRIINDGFAELIAKEKDHFPG